MKVSLYPSPLPPTYFGACPPPPYPALPPFPCLHTHVLSMAATSLVMIVFTSRMSACPHAPTKLIPSVCTFGASPPWPSTTYTWGGVGKLKGGERLARGSEYRPMRNTNLPSPSPPPNHGSPWVVRGGGVPGSRTEGGHGPMSTASSAHLSQALERVERSGLHQSRRTAARSYRLRGRRRRPTLQRWCPGAAPTDRCRSG